MDNQWEDYERMMLDEFIENHISNFTGRRQVLEVMQDFALARDLKNDKKALCHLFTEIPVEFMPEK